MDKIDLDSVSLECIAEKVNEIVDFVNQYREERIKELEKQMNLIQVGKYMTNEQLIEDIRMQCKMHEYIRSLERNANP